MSDQKTPNTTTETHPDQPTTQSHTRLNRYIKRTAITLIAFPILYILLSGPILVAIFTLASNGYISEQLAETAWGLFAPLHRFIDRFDPLENIYAEYLYWWFEITNTPVPG